MVRKEEERRGTTIQDAGQGTVLGEIGGIEHTKEKNRGAKEGN